MSLPALIAIHGLKRAGKGTISSYLVEAYGYSPEKFSGALKDMTRVVLRSVCGLDEVSIERCIEGDLKEIPIPRLGGKSVRYTTQVIGTEWRDTLSPTMWTEITLTRVRSVVARGGRVAIDDFRFPHEGVLLMGEDAALWVVTSSRFVDADQPLSILPWDPLEVASLDIPFSVLEDMMRVLAHHMGLTADETEILFSGQGMAAPVREFGGKSMLDALASLESVWLPLMRKPFVANALTTAAHISEHGLPAAMFDTTFTNDGTIAELRASVDNRIRQLANATSGLRLAS